MKAVINPLQAALLPYSGHILERELPAGSVGCAKNVLNKHDAVPEMKEGPSKSVCRNRLQTAVSCFSPKGCGGERYGKSRE